MVDTFNYSITEVRAVVVFEKASVCMWIATRN